jgi:general secretion pathway protein G
MDAGHYPELLDYLKNRPAGADAESWRGPYLKRKPSDPWGMAYIYKAPGEHNPDSYDLFSIGKDGQSGTADDVTNWGE